MDMNRMTQKSQEAIQAAQALATRFGHVEVDGEHLHHREGQWDASSTQRKQHKESYKYCQPKDKFVFHDLNLIAQRKSSSTEMQFFNFFGSRIQHHAQ